MYIVFLCTFCFLCIIVHTKWTLGEVFCSHLCGSNLKKKVSHCPLQWPLVAAFSPSSLHLATTVPAATTVSIDVGCALKLHPFSVAGIPRKLLTAWRLVLICLQKWNVLLELTTRASCNTWLSLFSYDACNTWSCKFFWLCLQYFIIGLLLMLGVLDISMFL